jgi:uncharacterized protein YbjT (DUF2867 family)
MKVIIYGATGMVGQGALRECLSDATVEAVLSVGRTATGVPHTKLKELLVHDLADYRNLDEGLSGYDACFFCLGTTVAGKSEAEYRRVTYDFTMSAAETLARLNPQMTFVYVSAAGADSSEKGPIMWARLRGELENALQRLPFKAVYILRPALIQPLDGIQSKTKAYRVMYNAMKPLLPLLKKLFPSYATDTRVLGRAMIALAGRGCGKKVLKSKDLNNFVLQ